MKTNTIKNCILNDEETLHLFTEFCHEGLRFLNVPENQYPSIEIGVLAQSDGKFDPLFIDYKNGRILIFALFFMRFLSIYSKVKNDNPSFYRFNGYRISRAWQAYLKNGEQRIFYNNADCVLFARALMLIKGLRFIDNDVNPNISQKAKEEIGFDYTDNQSVFNLLKDEFNMPCRKNRSFDLVYQKDSTVVSFTEDEYHRRDLEHFLLTQECNNRPLPLITEGELGSNTNPFNNVDDAASFILKIEQDRLNTDHYRQIIDNEQYFYDFERNYFRISWASAHVSFYPIKEAVSPYFVINQLDQKRDGEYISNPFFSIKPSLNRNKFLYRGQSQYFTPCKPNLFRNNQKIDFTDDIIQIYELKILLQQHPLVKLFEEGFMLFNDSFRFRVNYDGLSQHYYNRTSLLDLTSDMEVAKFFAVTTFDMENDCYKKYNGDELGVLYYFDLAADAFTWRKDRKYHIQTIGKQPFMRSGNQSGFLIDLEPEDDFNKLPEVRCIFFKHDPAITNRIFANALNGDKYMPQELLRSHWHNRMKDNDTKKKISIDAIKEFSSINTHKPLQIITEELLSKGFYISRKNTPKFTKSELDEYYATIEGFWIDFCSNIYFHGPEGMLMKKHLINLPADPRYKWAFYKS